MDKRHIHQAVIGLGANLGNPSQTLHDALECLKLHSESTNWLISPFYKTAPIGSDDPQPDYVNAVAVCSTSTPPELFIHVLLETEQSFGRNRNECISRNAPRTLDLDLLIYDNVAINTPELILPHPRLHQRAFVLRPLLDILPNCSAPGLGRLEQYLSQVENQTIERLI